MLGFTNTLMKQNLIKETVFNPNTIMQEGDFNTISACVAWYDFTDPSVVYKNVSGVDQISNNEKIARINNKSTSGVFSLGKFLRDFDGSNTHGTANANTAPTYKTGGVKGFSYAEFDNSSVPQCLMASNYVSISGSTYTDQGHGGGAGGTPEFNVGYYNTVVAVGGVSNAPNNNLFSFSQLESDNVTVFWVVKPSTSTPSGSSDQCHWLIRSLDAGNLTGVSNANRSDATYWEGFTDESNNELNVRCNFPDHNSGSGATYTTSGIAIDSSVNVIISQFGTSTDNKLQLGKNGDSPVLSTISESSNNIMFNGYFALGRWATTNTNSGVISNSGFDGEFYEILVYNKALDNTEIAQVYEGLVNKYISN